ncbi:MAG: DEAD/DEAH box helicase family protein [Prolixibacteraceae bacterium]|nr:DEAD/DEAH box helicase family protein [Prolixibacteraceae bacterium]
MRQPRRDWEKEFENHFCHQLDTKWEYQIYRDSEITVDKENCIHWDRLEQFWKDTQSDNLKVVKAELGYEWKKELGKIINAELQIKPMFQLLRDGLKVNSQHHLDLVCFKPETANNPKQEANYKKNLFSVIRQYHFTSAANARQQEDERQSIDIVICLNGFAIITVELKHTLAGQNVNDAVKQFCQRDIDRRIFSHAFVHIAADDEKAKIATTFSKPPTKDDFREFNTGLLNKKPDDPNEYAVQYLYNEILMPDSILNFIEKYLYGTHDNWIFPRYHQQRCVKRIYEDITEHFKKRKMLNLRYLIQHSAGSGKSNTIVWLVQNLRNLHIKNQNLFDHIIILTHRINLDDQISKDFLSAIGQTGVVGYCKTSNDVRLALGERLPNYRNIEIPVNSPVIVTILHKFSFLKDLTDQSGKRICFIIDEAHTNQEGKLHEKMVDYFDEATGQTIHQTMEEVDDEQEEMIDEISKKEFPNLCFIALTATPSDQTLQHFGKEGQPFDVYSMDEAIAEGYILDVAKNIITYETLYELNYKLPDDHRQNEYPVLQVYRALKLKAYEDDEVIKEKCKIIVSIFKDKTAGKIEGKAKSMVVTSSRLCAVKYKLYLDEELKKRGLKWKTLVAFSGQMNHDGIFYSEIEMNRPNNPGSVKIEDCFKENDQIRFLIVANKFQVGFDEKMLHTMFLDKALQDRNAVQTISRLNRIYPGKKIDTLTVDFTNSYDNIIKAFRKYQHHVESHKEANPDDLFKIKDELLKRGIFTLEDIENCTRFFSSENAQDIAPLSALLTATKGILEAKCDLEKRLEFRTLLARYVRLFAYIKSLFRLRVKDKILIDFNIFATLLYKKLDPTMSAEELEKEIERVKLKSFDIEKIGEGVQEPEDGDGEGGGNRGGQHGGSITNVRPMVTVQEVVMAINLQFKSRVSPESVAVVENYLQALQKENDLKTTIKNNLNQDEKQVYDLVIKGMMDKLYMDYIINNSPQNYGELTQENIQGFINLSAYKMLREIMKSAA